LSDVARMEDWFGVRKRLSNWPDAEGTSDSRVTNTSPGKMLIRLSRSGTHVALDSAGLLVVLWNGDDRLTPRKVYGNFLRNLFAALMLDDRWRVACGNKFNTVKLIHHVAKWDLVKPMA
jgi:hypothetical protein